MLIEVREIWNLQNTITVLILVFGRIKNDCKNDFSDSPGHISILELQNISVSNCTYHTQNRLCLNETSQMCIVNSPRMSF